MITLLAWSPVIVLFVLAVFFRASAIRLALVGTAWTAAISAVIFGTPLPVILLASIDGLLVTMPLLLVVYGGILLASVLIRTGSLARLAGLMTGAVDGQTRKLGLLTMGMANGLEGAGVIAEPVAAPMLRAAGLAPSSAAALSIIGYSGLMTLGLGGVIITVLSAVTGFDPQDLALRSAVLSIPTSVMMAWSLPLFAGRPSDLLRQFPLLTALGLIPGLGAWAGVRFFGYQVGELAGGAVLTLVLILPGLRRLKVDRQAVWDALPLAAMACGVVAVNTVPFLREVSHDRMAFAVSVLPGREIVYRPLADAYIYLFAAFALASRTLEPDRGLWRSLVSGTAQGWRPMAAMALFGALGQMVTFTGGSLAGTVSVEASRNIPHLVAGTLAAAGPLYPVLVPFLGWVGTFLTGYGVASIMLFAALQFGVAAKVGMPVQDLVCALAVGASLGGISSPFKVAFAASMCGAQGMEGEILRKTVPLGIAACLLLGFLLLLGSDLAFLGS